MDANTKVAGILARAGSVLPSATPLTFGASEASASAPIYVSDRRLYLSVSGDVVEEGDESAAYLLVGEGGALPQDLADELGVKGSKKKAKAAQDALPESVPITVIANPADVVPLPDGVQTVAPLVSPEPSDGPLGGGSTGLATATTLGTP